MRYEVKLALPERDLPRLRALLALLPSAPRPSFPDRVVQSLYFDTVDGAAVADNLAGVAVREKLRLRWYGEPATAVCAHLELKRRRNNVGDKLAADVPGPLDVAGVAKWRFLRTLMARVAPAWRERLAGTEVVQWIRYRRRYVGSLDGALRVTLDTELDAFDQRHRAALGRSTGTPLPRLAIVELKADLPARDELERWVQRLPWRPGRCSKLLLATWPVAGPLLSVGDG
jgi:hypothetical protein